MKSEVFPIQDLCNRINGGVLGQARNKIKVKVLIPAFNEARAIGPIIVRVQKVLQQINVPHEIIVIDDGSWDATPHIAFNLKATCNRNKYNRGKGFSIVKGFHLAKEDEFVITMDGDGEHYPEDIPALLRPVLLDEADMVIGSRFINVNGKRTGGSYLNNHKKYSLLRKFGNWIFSTVMLILTRKRINDTQSGFRVFRPGVVKKLCIQSLGFTIETEITAQVIVKGGRVKEVAIHNGIPLRGSYMHMVKDGLKIILTVIRAALPEQLKPILKFFLNY
ncbi:MAG: glycosyl transferase family protein 16 [Promethearchaeota archaeon CR_4]|nr:MAG: glycosyl transferase family protein 16 [Candidatus Lokiarchaeota archaeon CR_4]